VGVTRLASKKVHDMIYEARINCMHNWYAEHRKINFRQESSLQEAYEGVAVPPGV
jgi:hypothetical protein